MEEDSLSEMQILVEDEVEVEAEAQEVAGLGYSYPLDPHPPADPPLPATSPPPPPPFNEFSTLDIDAELEAIAKEGKRLQWDQARAQRLTEAPSPQMYKDVQDLLALFGLPFIVAPAEAEAQCAWLEEQGLVDGVVTDDNDSFLFGAKHVYRHAFEHKRYVEEYRSEDIKRELGMDRLKLAQMALLLGSDYTEGVKGVGVVNAVEILNAFALEEAQGAEEGEGGEGGDGRVSAGPLARFKEWVEAPDERLLEAASRATLAADRRKRKRRRKNKTGQVTERPSEDSEGGEGVEEGVEEEVEEEGVEEEGEEEAPRSFLSRFKEKHRAVSKTWLLPSSFPSEVVIKAYLQPNVDRDKAKFSFGRPNMDQLKTFVCDKFGWNPQKCDQLLAPVLAAYESRQGQQQLTIHNFFSYNQRFAKIKSKRLAEALNAGPGSLHPEAVYVPPPPEEAAAAMDDHDQGDPATSGGPPDEGNEQEARLVETIDALVPSHVQSPSSRDMGTSAAMPAGPRRRRRTKKGHN